MAAIRSRVMPEGGLDWLVAWEEAHGLAKEDEEAYSSFKMLSVAEARQVQSRQFQYVGPLELLAAGLMDAANRDKLEIILDYVEAVPELAADVEILRSCHPLPRFFRAIPNRGAISCSLSGDWLCLRDYGGPEGIEHTYHNFVTGAEFTLPYFLEWSPDGLRAASVEGNHLRIYDCQGQIIQEQDLSSPARGDIAWRDEGSLWIPLVERGPTGIQRASMYILTLASGSLERAEHIPSAISPYFYYGPQGRLAWKEGNYFYVYDGKATHALPLDNLIAVGAWSPDGKAMLLITAQEAYPNVVLGKALHYKIGGSVKELELEFGLSSMPLPLISWLNQDELSWPFPLATGQHMLGKYNLRTGEVTMTGIVLPQEVSGRRVLAQGVDGVYVYELD